MNKEEVIEQMEGNCMAEVSIACNTKGCNDGDNITLCDDIYSACEEFYSKGWRVDKDGYAICPKCIRKARLKKKK